LLFSGQAPTCVILISDDFPNLWILVVSDINRHGMIVNIWLTVVWLWVMSANVVGNAGTKHVQGILTEYVAQPGVQCYKDLAGNLKQVLVIDFNASTCFCQNTVVH